MKVLSLLLLVISVSFTSCGKLEEPKFIRVEGFGIKKLGLIETVIGFNTTYYNPNNFGVTVKEAVLDVYVDSLYLGKFNQPEPISVQNKAEFAIPLEGTISLGKALQYDIASMVGKETHIKANGSVKIGKAGVFVTKNINYSGRHRLDGNLLKNPAKAGSQN
jgi:LEA14-like dessication related protein